METAPYCDGGLFMLRSPASSYKELGRAERSIFYSHGASQSSTIPKFQLSNLKTNLLQLMNDCPNPDLSLKQDGKMTGFIMGKASISIQLRLITSECQ